MRRIDQLTYLTRATLLAAPALLLGCPGPEGDPSADGGVPCDDTTDECDADAGTRKPCGGFAGMHCDDGDFCSFEGTALVCGRFDGLGVCTPIPTVCTFESRPVCGCDGDTYPTACAAHAQGVSVEHDGACAPTAP